MKQISSLSLATVVLTLCVSVWAAAAGAGDITLPNGTQLVVKLTNTLSTKGSEEGDPWAGTVAEPIFAGGEEVVGPDSKVRGHVTFVQPAGRATGRGEMRLVAETISVPDKGTFTIVAKLQNADDNTNTKLKDDEGTLEGPGKSVKSAAKEAGIGAAVGAGVGDLAAGGKGALYGMAIGAMAGIVHTMAKKHQGPLLPPGTELTFVLNQTFLSKRITPPARANAATN